MLVYFGYTYCPDICPTALQNISEALNILDCKAKEVQAIFITIDPNRDTINTINDYKKNFHPSFIMLTGNHKQIDEAKKSYKVYSSIKNNYDIIDHSSIIYLMDKSGNFIANFNHETPPKEIVETILNIINTRYNKS